jgi:hypothetical protein
LSAADEAHSVTGSFLILFWSLLAGVTASAVAIRFRPMTTNRTILLLLGVLAAEATGFYAMSSIGPHRHWVDYLWPAAVLAGFLAHRLAIRPTPFFGHPFVPAEQRPGRDLARALAIWLGMGPPLFFGIILGAATGAVLENSTDFFILLAMFGVVWITPGCLTILWWAQGRTRRIFETYLYWFTLILVVSLVVPAVRDGLTPPEPTPS